MHPSKPLSISRESAELSRPVCRSLARRAVVGLATLACPVWVGSSFAYQSQESPQDGSNEPAANGSAGLSVTGVETSAEMVRTLIRAARDDAVSQMLEQIEAEAIARGVTAGQILDAAGPEARRAFRRMLEEVPQLGGPRYASQGIAQVQLQAGGDMVADALLSTASNHVESGGELPRGLSMEQLRDLLTTWRAQTFLATGRSASQDLIQVSHGESLLDESTASISRIPENDGVFTNPLWEHFGGVDDEGRARAIAAARKDVVEKLIAAASSVVLVPEVPEEPDSREFTLGDAFATGSIGQSSRRWLANQPLNAIELLDGNRIGMRLNIDAAAWTQHIREVYESSAAEELPAVPERQWGVVVAELRNALPMRPTGYAVAEPVGPSTSMADSPLAEALQPLIDPTDAAAYAPQWASLPIYAQATTSATLATNAATWQNARSRLMAARAAEADARISLEATLRDLPLGDRVTLGEVADEDSRAQVLIDNAVESAGVFKTDYGEDGSVRVTVVARGPSLWQSLCDAVQIK